MLSHSLVRSATRDSMKIAVPKEIKKQEYRVGLLPSVAYQLTQQGHTVLVERGAGAGTGYPDADYEQARATLMDDHAALFAEGDLVVKVKEPLPEEYGLLLPGQVLFT
jgi:alanine dehydrogenase